MKIIFNFNITIMVSFTRYTDDPIEYAPWGDARPYDGGFRYNCMMIQVIIIVIIVVNFIIMSPL